MDDKKVAVISKTNAQVTLSLPEYKFERTWAKKNSKILINKEMLAEAMFDPGVEYLFKQGLLYIEDMDIKKDLNLEDPDATEPENIIVLNDSQMRRLLTVAPVNEMKSVAKKMGKEQLNEFAQFAIELGDISLERSEIIKEIAKRYGIELDVARSILLRKQAEEKEDKNKE